jgi:hypothetical protein
VAEIGADRTEGAARHHRSAGRALALVAAATAPAILLAVIAQPERARMFMLGLLLAGGPASQHGTRVGGFSAVGCMLATAAAFAMGGGAVGAAALVGVLAFLGAVQARRGLHYPALQPAVAAGAASTAIAFTADNSDAIALTLMVGIGALFAVALLDLAGARPVAGRPEPCPMTPVLYFAIGLGALCGLATFLTVDSGAPHGAWLPVTLIVVAPPTFAAIVRRAAGATFVVLMAGLVGLSATAWIEPALVPVAALGICLAVALVTRSTYWRFATLLSSGVVLLAASGPDVLLSTSTRTEVAAVVVAAVLAGAAAVEVRFTPEREPPG